MAKTAKETAAEFLAEILAKLPAELQGKAKEVFEHAGAAPALDVLGGGVQRQSDYSRAMNDLQTEQAKLEKWHGDLTAWYDTKKAELAELETLKAGKPAPTPDPNKPAAPVIDPAKVVTPDSLRGVLDEMERGAVGFFSDLNKLSMEHFQQFGTVLDTDQLLKDKRVQQLGIRGVYQDQFKEQLAAKAKAAEDAKIEAIRKEERAKIQAEMANAQTPYPVRGNEPSTLDGLEAAAAGKVPQVKSVEEMANEYARLATARPA